MIARNGKPAVSQFYPVGFHGDTYLLSCVECVMKKTDVFIETGAHVGSTLAFIARTWPRVTCYSCEPDQAACSEAAQNIARENLNNVMLYNDDSQNFLVRIKRDHAGVFNSSTTFWLDAHGNGFEWPLKDEVRFITHHFTNAFVFIDDFLVPGMECFGYDHYDNQVCSFEYIRDALNPSRNYMIYYPDYREKTSSHHPLRGWGLITFGAKKNIDFGKKMHDKVRIQSCAGQA
ncbi:MAG: hypothetical protein GF350_13920 [Chitinivibrionales bacterium]|nr:hypothetical protein [Chitinivibrionales bacterium]